ncbi:MAG: energy transducer TonB [Pyrinomonadaceae bacterium]
METSKMPLNVRRFFASVLFTLFAIIFINAQTAPTSADVMRDRISKAKAFIVVKNYNAAIYELENIRRETSDSSIHAMLNVLLMHSYLEQSDYKRAQDFLAGLYKDLKAKKPNAEMSYYSVAGQIVKGARSQIERYKSVGLMVSDRNLPLEALVDIDKMRETLEFVITQSKELGADKKQTPTALPLLEEAINTRSSLAKDEYDANRWKLEVGDAREDILKSRSTIINAVDGTSESVPQNTVAANNPSNTQTVNNQTVTQTPVSAKIPENIPLFQPVQTSAEKPKTDTSAKIVTPKEEPKKVLDETPKQTEIVSRDEPKPNNQRQRMIVGQSENQPKKDEPKTVSPTETVAQNENTSNDTSPLAVGSLIEFATKRVNPVYPTQARSMRMTGVVKVQVTVDESGKVTDVQNTDGPSLLQRSAVDAVRKWQFKPFMRNGQPIKATGFVNFNFTL